MLHGNRTERTFLLALAAADAGSLAGLAGDSPFLHVDAGDKYPAPLRAFVAELDYFLRTGFRTGTATGTLVLIHHRKTCDRVHRDCTELAGSHTVPAAETSVETSSVPAVECGLDLT